MMGYDLLKSTKDIVNILGGDKSKFTEEQKSFFDWVRQKLPNSNWQVWAAKMFKKDPEGFAKFKDDLEHFGGSTHIKDIGDHRFDNKIHDTWEKGINELKEKENQYIEKIKQNPYLIKPSKKTKEIVPINDEWGWFDLGVPYCTQEGNAMGHCGNRAAHVKDDKVLSLRKKIKVGNEIYHEPHLTFIANKGYLGEMKGKGNKKPDKKYHPYIVKLLEHPKIKGVVGGGHAQHSNFSLSDLEESQKQYLNNKKPYLDVWNNSDRHILPSKFRSERDAMKWLKEFKENHGNDWKERFKEKIVQNLFDMPNMILNAIDYHGQDKDILEHVLKNANKIKKQHIVMHAGSLANDDKLKDLVWKSDSEALQLGLLLGTNVDKKDIEKGLNSESVQVRANAARSKHFGPEHMDKALSDQNPWVRAIAAGSQHLGPEHIDKALSDEHEDIRIIAVKSPYFKPEHMDKALSDQNFWVRAAAVESPHFGPEHMERALKDNNQKVVVAAIKSKHFGPQHVKLALNSKHPEARLAAVRSVHFGPEHMERALRDKKDFVACAAVESKFFEPKHVKLALNHQDPSVRFAAIQSEHFGPEHVELVLNKQDRFVARAAVESKFFKPEHVTLALNNQFPEVRIAAIKSPHFGPQHIEKALQDPDNDVRRAAMQSPHFNPKKHGKLVSDLKKSIKDIVNILGGDKSKFTPEQKDFFDWARQKLPNSNWQIWATKMFKKDPEGFAKFKDDLEHFGGSTHIKDIGDHRFDNKIHDTWEKGINELKKKENQYIEKIKQNPHLIKPSKKTKEIVPINDEWGWFDLGVPYCTQEGNAMGHCGNEPSHVEGDRVLSLRKKVKIGNNVYHEPHLTFIENNGFLGEMKGKGNEKPNKKYHPHIVKLLEHPKIRSVVGGGYAHYNNFSLDDLDPTIKNALIKQKPELDFWQSEKAVKDAPKKFRGEKDAVNWLNDIKKKNKENWKKELLKRIDHAPNMVLNTLDINGKDKDIFNELVDMAVTHNPEKRFPQYLSRHLGAIVNDPEHIKKVLDSNNTDAKMGVVLGPHLKPESFEDIITKQKDPYIVSLLVKNRPEINAKHVDLAMKHPDNFVKAAALSSPYVTDEHVDQAIMSGSRTLIREALITDKVKPRHLFYLLTHDDPMTQRLVPVNKLTPEMIEHAIMYSHPNTLEYIIDNVKLTPEQVDKAAKAHRLNHDILYNLLKKQINTPKLVENAFKNGHPTLQPMVARSPYITDKHLFEMLKSKDSDVVKAVFLSPKHNKKHVDMAVNSGNLESVAGAIHSPHFDVQHAIQALKNPQLKQLHGYLMHAFGHDEDVLDLAVNSGEEYLQSLAAKKKNLKPEHIEKLINTGNENVLINIAKNPIHTKNHLESILNYGIKNNNFYVVSSAIKSPHFTEQHLNKLEQHGSSIFDRLIDSYKNRSKTNPK